MDTLLVTGGAGFLGGCFVRRLLAGQNTRVVKLDNITYAAKPQSFQQCL